MKDHIYLNKEIVEKISNQAWRCVDLLHQLGISDSANLGLILISAYKDDVFPLIQNIKNYNFLEEYIEIIESDPFYKTIISVHYHDLKNINSRAFGEVVECLYRIDKNDLENHFSEIFEELLQKTIDYKGKRSGESVQPKEISKLVIELANLDSNAKVYNPFAGLASFSIYLNKSQEYFGQELNLSTWVIGQLRLRAHDKGYGFRYELSNSIESWNDLQKFDLIVATPPFGMKIQKDFHSDVFGQPYGSIEHFLIERGIHSLKNNGKLISVFSLSFLFNGGRSAKLKKWLIDNNLIDTIITLPSGLLTNTSIPICIIVFKTISSRPGYVKFINASSFFKIVGRGKKLRCKDIIELIDRDLENENLKYVSTEDIYENDFDLSVRRYFLKDIQGVKLSDFSSIIRGLSAPINEQMKQVQIRNLKDDIFDSILTSDDLENTLIKRGSFRVINESCLLIATRWNTLKPTFFNYTGEPIVISQAVVALKLDTSIVNPTFLINEFSSDYIQEQIDSYRVGSVHPILRNKDLGNIIFQLPSMQEQEAKVSGIRGLSKRLRKIELEKQNILSGIKKEESESSTSLSHILGKPLLSIGSSIEIIQKALSSLEPNWKGYMISQNRQFTLADAFDSISKNVKYIQELADKNTSLVSISNFELIELHFLKFLSEFVKDERKSLNNNTSLVLDIHEDIKELMDNQVLIKGNPQKLRILLVNLLDNAKNHAFTNSGQSNKINIEILPFIKNEEEASFFNYDIDSAKSYVEIKVSNTGSSFPKDFKLKDYVRKNFSAGKTKNTGLGGYEVNEILKAHNEGKNSLNIVSNIEDSEYSTTVSFIIPII